MTATVDITPEIRTAADVAGVLSSLRIQMEMHAWSAETSADSENWSPALASFGQCAVTALVVQDALGGDLVRCLADGVSHYFNALDGSTVDLTRDQFPTFTRFTAPEVRSREYVLSAPATARRYELLKERLARRVAAAS